MRQSRAAVVHVHRNRRHQRFRMSLAILVPIALASIICSSSPIQAHSWYPPHCCTGQDCKKVDQLEHLPDGSILMHFGGQQVVVPRGFTMQPSQDLEAHVCVFRGANGRWLPRCVFLPGTAMLWERGLTQMRRA